MHVTQPTLFEIYCFAATDRATGACGRICDCLRFGPRIGAQSSRPATACSTCTAIRGCCTLVPLSTLQLCTTSWHPSLTRMSRVGRRFVIASFNDRQCCVHACDSDAVFVPQPRCTWVGQDAWCVRRLFAAFTFVLLCCHMQCGCTIDPPTARLRRQTHSSCSPRCLPPVYRLRSHGNSLTCSLLYYYV